MALTPQQVALQQQIQQMLNSGMSAGQAVNTLKANGVPLSDLTAAYASNPAVVANITSQYNTGTYQGAPAANPYGSNPSGTPTGGNPSGTPASNSQQLPNGANLNFGFSNLPSPASYGNYGVNAGTTTGSYMGQFQNNATLANNALNAYTQNSVQPFQGMYNNPYAQNYLGAAQTAGNAMQNTTAPLLYQNAGAIDSYAAPLQNAGQNIYGAGQQALGGANQAFSASQASPYVGGTALNTSLGANNAANMAASSAPQAVGAGQNAYQAGLNTYLTSLDPQNALYNYSANQLMNQVNSQQALRGLGNSPEGLNEAGTALGNFNMNWENQQLARQAQGASALNSGASALNSGIGTNLAGAATSLSGAQSVNQGANTYYGGINNLIGGSNALNQGANTLSNTGSTMGGLSQGAAGLYNSAGNLANTAAQTMLQGGNMPYATQNSISGNQFTALNNAQTGLSNAMVPTQQTMNNALDYLGFGNSAQALQLQQQQINNQNNAMMGLGLGNLATANLSGANGGGTLLGMGISGLGSLFGSSAAAGAGTAAGLGVSGAAAGTGASGGVLAGLGSLLGFAA